MAGRLKNAIKKRASRLFHRDQVPAHAEGSASLPSDNRNSLNAPTEEKQTRHRKSLSLASKSSKTEPNNGPEIAQASVAQPAAKTQDTNNYLAHPAIQPLAADLTPRTPRLERPRPGLQSEYAGVLDVGHNHDHNESHDTSSRRASKQHAIEQQDTQHTMYNTKESSRSPDSEDLESRLSQLALSQDGSELPEIDIAPLTPFDLTDEISPTQARLSRLAIAQEGPEHPETHIEPFIQESSVNREANANQEASLNRELEAIHARDAEFERINEEVGADRSGEANFHLQNSLDFDRTVHNQEPVVHEHIRPHVHTIYEPKRTRSIHYHEHKTLIQPIKDPNPTILPEQHWLQDDKTGEIYRIPAELGKKLS
ncbi:hypothetical protein F66182_4780 [Fusarium sp. NRRL 66182]|nr:hypothetical protein F66182_4780 [Fusarium sp. NRRL 66182]